MSIEGYDFISFVFLAFIELSILGHSKRTDFKIFFNQGEWISVKLGCRKDDKIKQFLNTEVYQSNLLGWNLEFAHPLVDNLSVLLRSFKDKNLSDVNFLINPGLNVHDN